MLLRIGDKLISANMPHTLITRIIGIGILAAASLLMFAWITRSVEILHAIPGFLTVFNTAACFVITALALLAEDFSPQRCKSVQSALGGVLILWAGAVLAQYAFSVDFGIDWPLLHRWLLDSNPHPGRMALMSCVAFILIGIELILKHRAGSMISVMIIRGLNVSACLTGVMSIVGHALSLQFIFEHYLFKQLAVATAIGFVLVTISLWSRWRYATWNQPFVFKSEVGQILLASGAAMSAIAIICGLFAFGMMQRITETSFANSLARALDSRISTFLQDIALRIEAAGEVAHLPSIVDALRAGSPSKTRALQTIAAPLLDSGFSAVTVLDENGREIIHIGENVLKPQVVMPLQISDSVKLIWENGFFLVTETPIIGDYRKLGTAILEQPLPEIESLMTDIAEIGETSELLVCGAANESAICVPTRQRLKPFVLPLESDNNLTPMGEALRGNTGSMKYVDLRNVQALIAYAPVGSLGVAMSLRENTKTLYAPLRQQLLLVIPAISLLLGVGIIFLWSRIGPLAQKVAASEERLRLAIEGSQLALWDWDLTSGKIHLDQQWQVMLGGEPRPTDTTLAGLRRVIHPEDLPEVRLRLQDVRENRSEHYDVEHRVRQYNGEWLWIRSVGKVVTRLANGKAARFAGTNANIQERKQAALLLAHQAQHDALTNLPNRPLFYDRVRQSIARSKRYNRLMALLYLDIDKFKTINDSLGHGTGDALLKAFAQRLTESVRQSDTVARLGGDEFTVILDELGDRDQGRAIAQKIVEAMRKKFDLGHLKLNISTSVGIAFYDSKSVFSSEDMLIKKADEALYAAKAAGRDNYREAD